MSTSVLVTDLQEPHSAPADPHAERRLRSMVDKYFAFIWRCLQRNGTPEADIDDVLQRVFLTASRRLAEIRPGAERSFLLAAAMREAGHVRRSYRRRGEVTPEALQDKSTGALRPDELAHRRRALERVSLLLDAMDDELRAVFVLCDVEELSSQEVSQALGIPVGTVKSRLRRARLDFAARARAVVSPVSQS
jgi:RNA polymerase sigma-70 factor (ECF subfamily)